MPRTGYLGPPGFGPRSISGRNEALPLSFTVRPLLISAGRPIVSMLHTLLTLVVVTGLVVECRTRDFQVAGSNLTAGHLQATLSKLLTYGALTSTQPSTLRGTGKE